MTSTTVPFLNSRVAAAFFHGARPIPTLLFGIRLRARIIVGISQSSSYSSLVVKHLLTSAFSRARPIISPSGAILRTLLSPLPNNSIALVAPPADALRSFPLIAGFANTTAPPDSHFPTPLLPAGHPTSVSGPPAQLPASPHTASLSGKQRYSTAAFTRVNHVAASITAFEIALEPSEDPGSPPGDLSDTPGQVPRIRDPTRQSRSAIKGNLKTVIHGQYGGEKPSDDPQTLIVADFHFLSSPDGRRFRKATIEFVFKGGHVSYPNGIAPEGSIALYPDDLWNKGSLRGEEFDSLYGIYDPDAVGWYMYENSVQESGIPPELTVAMLLSRADDKPFTIEVKVTAAAGREGHGSFKAKKILPIRFDPEGEPIGLDALPPGTDINELSRVDIASLCRIGPVDSRETLRARGYCQCGLRVL